VEMRWRSVESTLCQVCKSRAVSRLLCIAIFRMGMLAELITAPRPKKGDGLL
jgi:hypothetical protein